jgi:hypothetical protein
VMRLFSKVIFSLWMAGSAVFAVSPDSLAFFRVDSIVCHRGDAFDDSKAYNFADSLIYRVGNTIHPETRESVVHKLLLFDVGDTVNLYELIESERYLRDQSYISDAHIIYEKTTDGKNVIHVNTSDNWTLTIPVSLEKPGDELYYGIGLQENNFLGFGQTVGFYYGHNEYRDMFSLLYQNSNFFFRHNSLRAVFSKNTDGYSQSFALNLPYLTRSKNQWAYTIEGLRRKQDETFYWSGKLPPGAAKYIPQAGNDTSAIPQYNGEHSNPVIKVYGMREDSASFRLGRSFGGSEFKVYLGATYDYHHLGFDSPEMRRCIFSYQNNYYAIADSLLDEWLPTLSDSRVGGYMTISRIRYDRLTNFRSAKWTEDVDKGYSLKMGATRNFEALGADNNDWRLDYNIYLAFGSRTHHLTMQGASYFYWDENHRHDIYETISAEYIWKTNDYFSSLLSGFMDTYKRAPYGQQLSLGGLENEQFYGFPSSLYAGQARFFGQMEQRFFPKFELGTVVPVFAVFARAGETANAIHEFEPDDLTYAVGFGVRFVMTKSVTGLVNHFDFSWPLNGPLVDPLPRFSFIGLFSL